MTEAFSQAGVGSSILLARSFISSFPSPTRSTQATWLEERHEKHVVIQLVLLDLWR